MPHAGKPTLVPPHLHTLFVIHIRIHIRITYAQVESQLYAHHYASGEQLCYMAW